MIKDGTLRIAFLSTYPPRVCGLATFTKDLVMQLRSMPLTNESRVIAVSNGSMEYDDEVLMELVQNNRDSYVQTAKKLNQSDIELVVIEHEFGIYGGKYGEYLLDFVNNLEIPFVTTLHTVLPEPEALQRHILNVLGQKGKKIITMAENTVDMLIQSYGINPLKIAVIDHGVPYVPMKSREVLKAEDGLENRFIISTFGLLSPGKGLEYGIEAIAELVKKQKNALYYILGQTHPAIKKKSGEAYRKSLEAMVKTRGLGGNVIFINKYLSKEEIIRYLMLSDVYMTPYLNKDQAVSGTLAYAVGYGRVIVSTPYSYAKEMLSEGRGLLAEFGDSKSIVECIKEVIDNPDEKEEMEQKTLQKGKTMRWENVAAKYQSLFKSCLKQNVGNRVKVSI